MRAWAQFVCSMCAMIVACVSFGVTWLIMTDATNIYAAWWPLPALITTGIAVCSFITMPDPDNG